MTFFPEQQKHKAQHGGYKKKPTKREVNALMNMYGAIGSTTVSKVAKKQNGKQLTLNLS